MQEDPFKKLVAFFTATSPQRYIKSQTILRPDDELGVFYIESGHIKIYSMLKNGDEKVYMFYKSGEFFPLVWAFNGTKKNVFFEAMEETVLYKVSREKFLSFVKQDPVLLEAALNQIITVLNIYVDRVDSLEHTKAYPRLISRLNFLADRFGKQTPKGILLDIPITHQDIANTVAMTRETTSREIEKLEQKDLLSHEDHSIIIKDFIKLKEELETSEE